MLARSPVLQVPNFPLERSDMAKYMTVATPASAAHITERRFNPELEEFRGRFSGKLWQFRANARKYGGIVKGRVGEDAVDDVAHPAMLELRGD